MIITNTTNFDTEDLRAIMSRLIKLNGWAGNVRASKLVVRVQNNRSSTSAIWGICGRAYVGQIWVRKIGTAYWIKIKLPVWDRFPDDASRQEWIRRFAQVFVHEGGHAFDELRAHGDMIPCRKIQIPDDILSMPVAIVTPKPKPMKPKAQPIDRARAKLIAATKKMAKHETKMKRAATLVKKWKKKVNYYQKRVGKLAASDAGKD